MALKKRYWSCIGYPESLPEDWKQVLTETGLPVCISPLHDRDKNETTDETKKPHYHILLCYDGPTTKENVKTLTDKLNSPMPVPVDSVRGAVRYMTHKDNPEKFQYEEKDIQTLNGFDLESFCELTAGEVNHILTDLVTLIREKQFTEYADLIDHLQDSGEVDTLNVAMSHTYFLDAYLKSARNKAKDTLKEYKKGVCDMISDFETVLLDESHAAREEEYRRIWNEAETWKKLLQEMPF